MWLVEGIRTATKSKGNVGDFQTDSLSTAPFMLISSDAQNTYLIYSVCRLVKNKLLKCFEYTVYKQSSCKLGHQSSGDLHTRSYNLRSENNKVDKVTKINARIISKPQAHLYTMEKTSAKFIKDRCKIV